MFVRTREGKGDVWREIGINWGGLESWRKFSRDRLDI